MSGLRVVPLTCGWITGERAGFIAGSEGRIKVPVPAFLIEHPKGMALFDTGVHPQAGTDPAARLGRYLARIFDIHLKEDEDVGSLLRSRGVDPERIQNVVLSHLHFDHAGGCELLPNARLIVQRPEWEAGGDPDLAARNGFLARDFQLGHPVLTVDGEHDLFGDGRVVCIPTYGHTPGHQSLRVRLDDGREVILCADACYLKENLDRMLLPNVVHDRDQMTASLRRLSALRDGGSSMVYGHDPEGWESVQQLLAGPLLAGV